MTPDPHEPQLLVLANGTKVKHLGTVVLDGIIVCLGTDKEPLEYTKRWEAMSGMGQDFLIGTDFFSFIFFGYEINQFCIFGSKLTGPPSIYFLCEDGEKAPPRVVLAHSEPAVVVEDETVDEAGQGARNTNTSNINNMNTEEKIRQLNQGSVRPEVLLQ